MLETLTEAENKLLVELATVKAHLRPAVVGSAQDDRLNDLIRWASASIVRWCRRPFARQEYRETLPGTGFQYLMLSAWPLECDPDRLLPSVTWLGSSITDYRVEDKVAAVLWRLGGWPQALGSTGRFGSRPDPSWLKRDAFVAEFWAGYLLPGDADVDGAQRLPGDVERAALLTALHYYRNDTRDPSLTSTSSTESEGDSSRTVSASYDASAARSALGDPFLPGGAIPREAMLLLKDYRR